LRHLARPEGDGESRLTAEIIEFPCAKHEDRLVSAVVGLEEIVREVEHLAAEQPADSLNRLLTVMERLGDQLVESSLLLLDEDSKGRVQTAFTSLSAEIIETREAFDELGGRKHP
jgi:hypothetical protein